MATAAVDPSLDKEGLTSKMTASKPKLSVDNVQTPGTSMNNGPRSSTTAKSFTHGTSFKDKERKIGHRRIDEAGQTTYKKVSSSQIMASIQLGIGHSVGGLASKPDRDLLMQDFTVVETVFFPSEGSNLTAAHHYSDFRFKNYSPLAFRYFRELFGIQPDDFLLSLCNEHLRELSNPGASGSIFYITNDDEFIIKTVQHKEAEFLQKLLPGYYMNLNQNPRTLLPKFFGLYCYQCGGKNIRLAVMNNLLPSSIKIHQKYDLKGSTYKRKANKYERNKDNPTFKDLDFMENHPEGILLEADTYTALIKTIQRDCRVLESFKIMDYSLLVGIHNLDQAAREKAEATKSRVSGDGNLSQQSTSTEAMTAGVSKVETPATGLSRAKSINRQRLAAFSTVMESIQADAEPVDLDQDDVPAGGIPARNAKGERVLLFLGLIDILQCYKFKKKLEHTWKAMLHDGDTVSVHRPSFYAQRFQDFMAKTVFRKVPSLDHPEIKGPHRKFRTLVYLATLKHSPSKKKGQAGTAGVRLQRPLSASEGVDTIKEEDSEKEDNDNEQKEEIVAGRGKPDIVPVSSTPPPSFDEATKPRSDSEPLSTSSIDSSPLRTVSERGSISSSVVTHTSASLYSEHITVSSSGLGSSNSVAIRQVTWTPPHSIEGSTPTHTEGTPSYTDSSSSGDLGCPTTPIKFVTLKESDSEISEVIPDKPVMESEVLITASSGKTSCAQDPTLPVYV